MAWSASKSDLYAVDLGQATVVTLYLPPRMNAKLVPRLGQLRPGARVVCHRFGIPGVVADRVIIVPSKEGSDRKLFLYTTPLKAKAPERYDHSQGRTGSGPEAPSGEVIR